MYKILKNIIEMDDYSVQKLSNLQPPEPFEWNTVEVTELNVNDCIGGKGKIEVKGNTEQKQLSGKNLFNHYLYPSSTTFKGVTITHNGDGSFTLNGTCTENNTSFILGNDEYIKNLLKEGDVTQTAYYISGTCTKAGSSSSRTIIRFNYDTGTDKMIPLENLSTQRIISKINPQTNRETSWSWRIVLDAGDTFNNFTIKYQVEKGSVGTDWEPYCGGQASPNPDYPQEIKVVTGDNVVKHVGKNLFDKDNANIINAGISSKVISTSEYNRLLYIPVKSSTTYTIKRRNDGDVNRFRVGSCTVIPANNVSVPNSKEKDNETNITITTGVNDKYLAVMYYRTYETVLTEQQILNSIQIEEGTTATPYEEYRGEEYEVYLPSLNKNILDTRYTKVGSVNAETGKYVYNSNNLMGENYIKVEPNTTYCLSGNTTFSGIRLSEYDENKTHIKRSQSNSPLVVITTTNNTHYVRWSFNYNSQPVDINLAKTLELQLELGNLRTSFIECEPLELCKIGDYSDILFKNVVGDENYNAELEEGAWYKKNVINKRILDGSENWAIWEGVFLLTIINDYKDRENTPICDYYKGIANVQGTANMTTNNTIAFNLNHSGLPRFFVKDERFSNVEDFKNGLSTHNIELYYVLATPTYEKITDPNLISQLEALRKAKWFKGVNHWWTETNNLEPVLKGTYRQAINE